MQRVQAKGVRSLADLPDRGHCSRLLNIYDNASWEKNAATLKQLHGLRERLKVMEQTTATASRKNPEKS